MKCLVLDAMGVIFHSADDVAELLIPFVTENGGIKDAIAIDKAYHAASLGEISADDFWIRVGLSAEIEDEYLARHRLNAGVTEILHKADSAGVPVWCLSNDIGRWSQKLRSRLGLDTALAGAIISGDVGIRKPDAQIYQILLDRTGFFPKDMLFADDRDNNVSAAIAAGLPSLLFSAEEGFAGIMDWLA